MSLTTGNHTGLPSSYCQQRIASRAPNDQLRDDVELDALLDDLHFALELRVPPFPPNAGNGLSQIREEPGPRTATDAHHKSRLSNCQHQWREDSSTALSNMKTEADGGSPIETGTLMHGATVIPAPHLREQRSFQSRRSPCAGSAHKLYSVKSFQRAVLSVDFDPAGDHIRLTFLLLWLLKTTICWRTCSTLVT